jgi:hypothetical protein
MAQISSADERRRSLKPLRRLFPYITRYRTLVVGAIISLVIAAATTLALPLAVRRMIDHGFSSSSTTFIAEYFAALVAMAALLAAASAGRYYFVITLGERVVADIRRDVFAHVTTLSPAFFDTAQSGEIVSRLAADTTQVKSAVGATASVALRNVILGLGAVGMMVITSPKLSGLVIAAIPAHRAAAGRLRPFGAAQVAAGAGHAGRCHSLCQRADRRGAHAAGLHQREAGHRAFSVPRWKLLSRRHAPRSSRAPSSPSLPFSPSSRPSWRCCGSARATCSKARYRRARSASSCSIRCSPPARSARCRKSGANLHRRRVRPNG